MPLLNKFIFLERKDYYQSGQITAQACDCVYLVKLDPGEGPPVSVLVTISEMLAADCFIFDTHEEMEAWLAWVERDDEKVVKLKDVKRVEH